MKNAKHLHPMQISLALCADANVRSYLTQSPELPDSRIIILFITMPLYLVCVNIRFILEWPRILIQNAIDIQ